MSVNKQLSPEEVRACASGLRDGMGGHADYCADIMEQLSQNIAAAERAGSRPTSVDFIKSVLACEIEADVFERHVVPALEVARKVSNEQAQQAEPVAWRVHPFDYGIGSEGVFALTMRIDQVDAWKKKGWAVEPLYAQPPSRQPWPCRMSGLRL